jgi:hypothetical protein
MATKATGVVVSNVELTVNESKFHKQSVSLFEEADQITVRSPEDMRKAIEFGRGIADLIMNITAFFGPLKKTAKAAHTALCDKEKEALDIPRQAESVVDAAIRKYRQAEAAKAQAAADKERARLQAQAEKERAEAVRLLKAEGEKKLAREVEREAIVVPVVDVQVAAKVTSGVRYRTKWHFEIIDPAKVERRFLVPSEQLIRAEVILKKGLAVGTIDGVRVWSTEETDY